MFAASRINNLIKTPDYHIRVRLPIFSLDRKSKHKFSLEQKLRRSFDDICKNYHCTLRRVDDRKSKHDEKHLEFHFNLITDDANVSKYSKQMFNHWMLFHHSLLPNR
ncbi:hypothetical protein PHET_10846 [Paragonimus heterotremus]|uniref:Uncharacterized protein n=1 Tax=Paragonimus heterotremus TaxID=100268 RepID=A0A8J4SJS2_9TREM|nr:hypothetical protein PHET_10846 [Paragonimus heterotremus]